MAPRSQTIDPSKIQVVHTWSRVVRRSFLCGYDQLTGIDYEHRRQWIQDRLKRLARVYAVDIGTFSIMHNHHHLLLRNRPDIVQTLDDEEVVRRLMLLEEERWFFPDGAERKSTRHEIERRKNDKVYVDAARLRLSDISKFMQSLNQHVAVKSNREDDCSGKFFEFRFGHEVLADTTDILACKLHIDLNPIHAQIASTPEESDFSE